MSDTGRKPLTEDVTMLGFFSYLRKQVKEAFVGGVADAVDELDSITSLEEFRARLSASVGINSGKALAAAPPATTPATATAPAEAEEPAKKRGGR